jgi:drug/metabolite transporter (DMT)-like permease
MSKSGSILRSPSWGSNFIFVVALIPPTLWATSIIAAKVVVSSLPPFTAATARFVLATAIMWGLWAFLPERRQRPQGRDWVFLALAGFFQTSLYFALQYAGVKLTSAANTAVIVNVRPIFVTMLAVLLLNERLTARTVAAIILGFSGVLIIASQGSLEELSLATDHVLGDMLIVLNALSGAIGLILTKKVLGTFNPLAAMIFTITFGTIGLIPFAAFEIWRTGGIPATTWLPWLLLVYQAVFCSVVAHFLWNNVLSRLDASKSAVFLYVTPVVGVILAYFLLGEAITVYFAIGAILVLAGAYQSTRPDRVRRPSPAR